MSVSSLESNCCINSTHSTVIRLRAAVLSPKNPFFHSVQANYRIQTRVLPNRNQITVLVVLPGRFLLSIPPPNTFYERPTPEE